VSVTEIDPFAFSAEIWPLVEFEGPPRVLAEGDFLCPPDSVTMLRCLSRDEPVEVPAHIEVIGRRAFGGCFFHTVIFASGGRLREIGDEAFSDSFLRVITVPSSIEIIGDRCFENCRYLARLTFEEKSKLKKIGERAFAFSAIKSFTIPGLVNEMDGSAFLGCPLEAIDIDPGNLRFIVRGNTLVTSDGTEIVRSFGDEREIFVGSEVEVLQKLCFESSRHLTKLIFESVSKLRKICRSALSDCDSLRRIVVPASVTEIEESAFKDCIGLEECSIHKDGMLVKIGREAFAGCSCLRSFYVPKTVEVIGENCFKKCPSLFQLKFGSGDTLEKIVGAKTLDETLEHLGFSEISGLFRIEVDNTVSDFSFPGWAPVADASSHFTFGRDFS
jgi:hypothetical protein